MFFCNCIVKKILSFSLLFKRPPRHLKSSKPLSKFYGLIVFHLSLIFLNIIILGLNCHVLFLLQKQHVKKSLKCSQGKQRKFFFLSHFNKYTSINKMPCVRINSITNIVLLQYSSDRILAEHYKLPLLGVFQLNIRIQEQQIIVLHLYQ